MPNSKIHYLQRQYGENLEKLPTEVAQLSRIFYGFKDHDNEKGVPEFKLLVSENLEALICIQNNFIQSVYDQVIDAFRLINTEFEELTDLLERNDPVFEKSQIIQISDNIQFAYRASLISDLVEALSLQGADIEKIGNVVKNLHSISYDMLHGQLRVEQTAINSENKTPRLNQRQPSFFASLFNFSNTASEDNIDELQISAPRNFRHVSDVDEQTSEADSLQFIQNCQKNLTEAEISEPSKFKTLFSVDADNPSSPYGTLEAVVAAMEQFIEFFIAKGEEKQLGHFFNLLQHYYLHNYTEILPSVELSHEEIDQLLQRFLQLIEKTYSLYGHFPNLCNNPELEMLSFRLQGVAEACDKQVTELRHQLSILNQTVRPDTSQTEPFPQTRRTTDIDAADWPGTADPSLFRAHLDSSTGVAADSGTTNEEESPWHSFH